MVMRKYSMKCTRIKQLISVVLFLLIGLAGGLNPAQATVSKPSTSDREPISVVMDDNYPPYVFRDENGELKGILIDQLALWSQKTGINANITAMDWADALAAMKKGEYDVLDTVFRNEERDAWLDFTDSYVTINVVVFHDKEIGGITDIRSLRGFAVAVKADDNCIQILKHNGITNIVEYPSYEAIVNAAKNGETRVFVMDKPPAIYLLYKNNIATLFNEGITIDSGAFHRAVKSGDTAILQQVEDGFSKITDAEYKSIDQTWFGKSSNWMYTSLYFTYLLIGLAAVCGVVLLIIMWNYRLRKAVHKKTTELFREKELLNITIQSIGDCVVATDIAGKITLINPTARSLTGWGDDAINQPFLNVIHLVGEDNGDEICSPIERVLQSGEIVGLANHTELISRTGERIPIADSAAPIRDEKGHIWGVVMVFRDIKKEKEYRDRIEYMMTHDSMTNLYNRWYMENTLKRYEHDPQASCALIMGDLNGLKLINDAFGHRIGDLFIQKISIILKECCGANDIVGRWGGDEFLVIQPKADAQDAEAFIERVSARCAEQSDSTIHLSISMGFALKIGDVNDINEVLREAEQWTYRRKLMIEKSFRNSVINALLSTLAAKSEETQEHAKRLQDYCDRIGRKIGISSKELDEMSILAILHDIGKIGISDNILQKPEPLTEDEWLEMRKHPEIGYRIAQNNIDLAPISECILSHHERWNGKGYPRGLCAEEIPILSRILAVVDAFDAMTNDRIYRKATSIDEAVAEIIRNAGTQFDPVIAKVFVVDVLGLKWVDGANLDIP